MCVHAYVAARPVFSLKGYVMNKTAQVLVACDRHKGCPGDGTLGDAIKHSEQICDNCKKYGKKEGADGSKWDTC